MTKKIKGNALTKNSVMTTHRAIEDIKQYVAESHKKQKIDIENLLNELVGELEGLSSEIRRNANDVRQTMLAQQSMRTAALDGGFVEVLRKLKEISSEIEDMSSRLTDLGNRVDSIELGLDGFKSKLQRTRQTLKK